MAETVYTQIADELRRRITSGDLAPGQEIPTEAELASAWQSSRGPVRNALALLRREGLVDTARGRAARVSARKATQAVDVSIPFTTWARDIGATPGARTQELSVRRASAEKAALLHIEEGTPIVDVLRLRLLDGRPTMLERLTYTEPVGRVLFGIDLDAISITAYLESHGHALTDVDHEIDAVPADELDATLLEIDPGAPTLRLQRISYDDRGQPFEASDERYRSDLVRFTVSSRASERGEHFRRAVSSPAVARGESAQ